MNLLRNSLLLIFLTIVAVTLFYLANSHSIASRLVNMISPCKQDSVFSFPCHSEYDIALMLISGILIISFIIMLAAFNLKQRSK